MTRFVVTPVVALVRPGFELALDAFEVRQGVTLRIPSREALTSRSPRLKSKLSYQTLPAST